MIETERLILRPWHDDDAETLYRYAKDPAIGSAAGWPAHRSVEESREIIRTVFADPEVYAVELKNSGEAVGCCGLLFGESANSSCVETGHAEIGYWIGVPFWGRGLIPEAVNALVGRCFGELNLSAVWIGYYDGNDKSRRVAEKCGFAYHHTEHGKFYASGDLRTEHFMIKRRAEHRRYALR